MLTCTYQLGLDYHLWLRAQDSKDFARKAKRVMVDIDAKELKNTRVPIDHKINVDTNYFIKKLNKELPRKIGLEKKMDSLLQKN